MLLSVFESDLSSLGTRFASEPGEGTSSMLGGEAEEVA